VPLIHVTPDFGDAMLTRSKVAELCASPWSSPSRRLHMAAQLWTLASTSSSS
jgi:hypothetical protein